MYGKKKLPVDNLTFLRVLNCTDNSRDFAVMICTFIDLWAEDHGISKVQYAAHIADMVRKKVEGGQ